MKSANPTLIGHLNSSQQYMMADLFTFTLLDGSTHRYAAWDLDVSYNGFTYKSSAPLFERSRVRTVIGVEVDTLDLKVYSNDVDMLGSFTWAEAASKGILDGATMLLERVFFMDSSTTVGGYINFSGRIADISMSHTQIDITVKSDLELLNIQMPRNLYQAGCQHTLYNSDCGLSRNLFRTNGAISFLGSKNLLLCNVASQPDGFFDMGYVEFNSGVLDGTKRTVKRYSSGQITLMFPLPALPDIGDTFYVYAGCDKTQSTCKNKFNNLANFRGFPYIPVPETTR